MGLLTLGGAMSACDRGRALADPDSTSLVSWSSYLDDGDVATLAPGALALGPSMSTPPPPRSCVGSDCASQPLALWTFDDCNAQSSELNDSATSSTRSPTERAPTHFG